MRSANRRLAHLLLPLIALLAAACVGGQTGSEAKGRGDLGKTDPCEPLGALPEPVELGEVVGVGRDAAGTLYVVDRDPDGTFDTDLRAFVSEGETLIRKSAGPSSIHQPGYDLYLFSMQASPSYRLVVELVDGAVRMARTQVERPMSFDELETSDHLESVDPSEIEGLALRDLPGEVRVEYFARTPMDELLLVTVPEEDFSYDKFRLFFGPAANPIERVLNDVIRRRDGGTTNLLFTVAGVDADAFFPITNDGRNFMPGPATLKIGDETVPLERLDAIEDGELIDAAMFRCLR